jgi:hypothetical protein
MKSAASNDKLRVSRVVRFLVSGITETERKANNSPLHEKYIIYIWYFSAAFLVKRLRKHGTSLRGEEKMTVTCFNSTSMVSFCSY